MTISLLECTVFRCTSASTTTIVLTSVASRAFTVAVTVWNSLSVNTELADNFASKRRLKSELFASTYAT